MVQMILRHSPPPNRQQCIACSIVQAFYFVRCSMGTSRRGWAGPAVRSLKSPLPAATFAAAASPLAPFVVSLEEAAQMFGKTFYDALIGTRGHTVQRAFDIAFSTVNAGSTDPQGGPFLLLPRGEKGATSLEKCSGGTTIIFTIYSTLFDVELL